MRLPYCAHPDSSFHDDDYRTKLTFRPEPSLGLVTLCAFLDQYKTFDYDLKAIDLNIEAYTEPGIPIDISVYNNLLINYIKNNEYDVLALSAMFIFNIRWVDSAVRLSRKYHPEAKIIIGGGYPTLFPEKCLKEHEIDDCVIGEGEATFLHILNKYNNYKDEHFENKFPFDGYLTRSGNGKIVTVPKRSGFLDMADLPTPAWDYLDVEKYFRVSGNKTLCIEGSRGCPYRCTYCCVHLSWGRNVRYKPVDTMINEIMSLQNKYKDIGLVFTDDNLSFSKKWITHLLTNMVDMGLHLNANISNFSVKHLDEEIIDLLVKVGVKRFGVAVETGSPEMQKKINKRINFDKVREIVKIMKNRNLHVHLMWMIGFPNETIDQINMTFDLARELRADSNQFLVVLPFPGTQLFDEVKSLNILAFDENNLDNYDNYDCRKSDYIKSKAWNYSLLQDMIYDASMEINFLNNPGLETMGGRELLLNNFKNLILSLPEHVVAHIVIGYIYHQKNNVDECERHYNMATDLLRKKELNSTYSKYISWNNPVINDYYSYTIGLDNKY